MATTQTDINDDDDDDDVLFSFVIILFEWILWPYHFDVCIGIKEHLNR